MNIEGIGDVIFTIQRKEKGYQKIRSRKLILMLLYYYFLSGGLTSPQPLQNASVGNTCPLQPRVALALAVAQGEGVDIPLFSN